MAVGFILGRSGTGKTSRCIRAITEALLDETLATNLIFLVPEQATYQAEKAILNSPGVQAFTKLSVLSFSRLQFMLLGRGGAKSELSDLGRELVIHRILRQNAKELKVFSSCASYPGMASRIAQTIIEFQQYGLDEADADSLASKLMAESPESFTSLKFSDIAYVYRKYLADIQHKFVNPDIQLSVACGAVKNSHLIKDSLIWVDGFSGFTAQELAMLAELMKTARCCRIALCLDPDTTDLTATDPASLDGADLFNPTQRTLASIVDITKKNNIPLIEPVILKTAGRFNSPELAYIEKNLFKPFAERIENTGCVTIAAAPNIRAEVVWAASQIRDLARHHNWRWRDVAIIASDLNAYRHYIQAALEDFHIPFFLDLSRPLCRHPVAELLMSAMQMITAGFKTSDVLCYLKTDLAACSRDEVDQLENYILALGIDGADYRLSEWTACAFGNASFEIEKINAIRQKAVEPVLRFESNLKKAQPLTARTFGQIVFAFLKDLGVDEKLSQWLAQAQSQNDHAKADEHGQFINLFKSIFTEMAEVFEDDPLTIAELQVLLSRAFEKLSLRLIPPGLDQVLVGSVERSRHPDLKAVFLLGATQKAFPVSLSSDSILTDGDREQALRLGHQLADGTLAQLVGRQYLAYIAFTRPSARLYISYPINDEKGASITCSSFVSDLKELFINISTINIAADIQSVEPASISQLTQNLCMTLGRDSDAPKADAASILRGTCDLMRTDPALAPAAAFTVLAVAYTNQATLDTAIAEKLFAGVSRISHSRISKFASCPYSHFAKYALSLSPRPVFRLEAVDLGDFYHKVLDTLFKQTQKDFSLLELSELKIKLQQAIDKVMLEEKRFGDFASRNQLNRAIFNYGTEVLEDLVCELRTLSSAGLFRQSGAEVSFGSNDKRHLPAIEIRLDTGRTVYFAGKIDRLDIANDNSNSAIVFDFKTSQKNPDFCFMYHGIDLQLASYLLAVEGQSANGSGPLKVVGAFYIPINSPAKNVDYDSFTDEKFGRKAKGLFDGDHALELDQNAAKDSRFYNFYFSTTNSDPYGHFYRSGALHPNEFKDLLTFAHKKITSLAKDIFSGSIASSPYRISDKSPCSNCDFKSLCRFDWRINDYDHLTPISKESFLDSIRSVSQ